MHLLVIRHAIAEDRDIFAASGKDDGERPLTDFGRRRMKRNAQGLHRVAPHLDLIAASPLVRAQQTARIVADAYRLRDVATVEAMLPDRHPRELLSWLSRQPADATIAVVGHEPQVGLLVAWSVGGVTEPSVAFKKGGAALLEFPRKPAAAKGILQWLLTPAQLRAMGE
jgi:phosphohistidine phosphatase